MNARRGTNCLNQKVLVCLTEARFNDLGVTVLGFNLGGEFII